MTPPVDPTALIDELCESLRSGYLFGHRDEPLDAYGRRLVRVIELRLRALASPATPATEGQPTARVERWRASAENAGEAAASMAPACREVNDDGIEATVAFAREAAHFANLVLDTAGQKVEAATVARARVTDSPLVTLDLLVLDVQREAIRTGTRRSEALLLLLQAREALSLEVQRANFPREPTTATEGQGHAATAQARHLASSARVLRKLLDEAVDHDNGYRRCRWCRSSRHAEDWSDSDHIDGCLVLKAKHALSALTAATAAQEAEIASLNGRIESAIACAQRDCEVNPQFRGGLEPIIGILGASHG